MAKITFPHYSEVPDIRIDDQKLLGVFAPQHIANKAPVEDIIRR